MTKNLHFLLAKIVIFWQISEIFFLHGASHRMEPKHRILDVLENKNSMNHTRSRIFA